MPLCLTLQYFDRLNGIKTKPSVISNVILTEGVFYSVVVIYVKINSSTFG